MLQKNKLYLKTFGCAQNESDSERVKTYYQDKGYKLVDDWKKADLVVINSCVIRESAENRVYGLIDEIRKAENSKSKKKKIILTGCLVPISKKTIKGVDEMMPIKKISFKVEALRDRMDNLVMQRLRGELSRCASCMVKCG